MSALSVLSPVNQRGAGGDTPAITPSLLSGQGGALVPACLARRHAARPLQWSDDRGGSAVQLTALCDNIEATHHAFLREMLPRLSLLTEAMARAYGESHPRLCALREAFANFRDAMESNLDEEAGAVFPLCRRLDTAGRHVPFHGTLTAAIRLLDAENEDACASLARIHALTDGFTPPAGAVAACRALLRALDELEADVRGHARKENELLFPAIRRLTALHAEPGFPNDEGAVE